MGYLKPLYKWGGAPSLILVIALCIVGIIITPNFLSANFFIGFFGSYTPLILIAMGQAIVLIAGGFDISLGAILSLVNVCIVHFLGLGWGLVESCVAGIVIGLCIGALNGAVVSYLRVSPLLVTLATSSIAGGIALWIQPNPGGMAPLEFILWYQTSLLGIPVPILFVLVSCLLWAFLRFTPIGIQIYAVGDDVRKAYVSGLPITKIKFFSYILSSLMAGIGAVAITANIGSGDPLVGLTLTLNSIAACVIGGISLAGGIGSISGAIFGSIFLGLVFTTVLSAQISPFFQGLLSAVIVLISIMGASISQSYKAKIKPAKLL